MNLKSNLYCCHGFFFFLSENDFLLSSNFSDRVYEHIKLEHQNEGHVLNTPVSIQKQKSKLEDAKKTNWIIFFLRPVGLLLKFSTINCCHLLPFMSLSSSRIDISDFSFLPKHSSSIRILPFHQQNASSSTFFFNPHCQWVYRSRFVCKWFEAWHFA